MKPLPYRRNVGAVLFNAAGLVFVGRRAGLPPDAVGAWQFPQGGLDKGERPRAAVLRELREEIGTDRVEVLDELAEWLTYDLPADIVGKALGGRYRGQRQRWFALRFTGVDAEIRLDADGQPEFSAWRWVPLAAVPAMAVGFRQPIYARLVQAFGQFAA